MQKDIYKFRKRISPHQIQPKFELYGFLNARQRMVGVTRTKQRHKTNGKNPRTTLHKLAETGRILHTHKHNQQFSFVCVRNTCEVFAIS